jgi:hypothetical protein
MSTNLAESPAFEEATTAGGAQETMTAKHAQRATTLSLNPMGEAARRIGLIPVRSPCVSG